jgi:tRNA threonylcarbamoyl adenosine modification protein YeaZ
MQGYCSSNNHLSPYAAPTASAKLWSYAGTKPFYGIAIGADGTAYVGSDDASLHAIGADGTKKWAFAAGNSVRSTPAIGADGTLYFGCEDGLVYAVNPDGTKKWTFMTGSYVNASPVIGPDGTIYIGSWDHSVYALAPDGTKKWDYAMDDAVTQAVALGPDAIHAVDLHSNLVTLGLDGKKTWTFLNSNTTQKTPSPPSVGPDGSVYLATYDQHIEALDASGKFLWSFTGSGDMTTPTVAADGTVYSGSTSSFVYIIGKDGQQSGSFTPKDSVKLAPVLTADQKLVVGSKDGNVYVTDRAGKQLSALKTTGAVISLAIGDGRVLVVTDDGNLSAYGQLVYPHIRPRPPGLREGAATAGLAGLGCAGDDRDAGNRHHVSAGLRGEAIARGYDGSGDHAERILEEASALLAAQGIERRDIGAVAVCVGPGSFTGVRVGVATAKAIALATGASLVTASALLLMTAGFEGPPGPRVAVIDARRGEVFVGAYDDQGRTLIEDQHLPVAALAALVASLPGSPVLLGWWPEGVEVPGGARRVEASPTDPLLAATLARMGRERLARGEVASVGDLEPLYLRPPDATLPPSPSAKNV